MAKIWFGVAVAPQLAAAVPSRAPTCAAVDAKNPVAKCHSISPSGSIAAEFRQFIPASSPEQAEVDAQNTRKLLRVWDEWYPAPPHYNARVYYPGDRKPDRNGEGPIKLYLSPWVWNLDGSVDLPKVSAGVIQLPRIHWEREATHVVASFGAFEPLTDGEGWVMKGELAPYDPKVDRKGWGADFTGTIQTEVRVVKKWDAQGTFIGGVEVRDRWLDVQNNRRLTKGEQFTSEIATKVHLGRSELSFGNLAKKAVEARQRGWAPSGR